MFLKILIFLFLFVTCACASFHCSKEVQWLLEDARLHEALHTSYDAMIAERFRSIADHIDTGKADKRQIAFDLLFIYKAKHSHEGLKGRWHRMWIDRYDKIAKKLLEIYNKK